MAGNPPVRVAWSVTDEPTMIVAELMVVVIAGVCLLTVNGSQLLVTALLFVSPLYAALNAKLPAEAGVTEEDTGTAFPAPTVTVEVEVAGAVQAPLLKKL